MDYFYWYQIFTRGLVHFFRMKLFLFINAMSAQRSSLTINFTIKARLITFPPQKMTWEYKNFTYSIKQYLHLKGLSHR